MGNPEHGSSPEEQFESESRIIEQITDTAQNIISLTGFSESPAMSELPNEETGQYLELAAAGLAALPAEANTEYQLNNIGLYVSLAERKRQVGRIGDAITDLEEAQLHAQNVGRDDIAGAIDELIGLLEIVQEQ